ncbi:MAG TPA: DUF3127 domain-containing protein [Mariniphaga sp.]|nr:DUF3127 domain-containing protein [Mariniphaga sp.]
MSLKIKGTIQQILNVESGVSRAGNEWKKQEFVLETTEQFAKKVCFTLFNDKLSLIDNINTGDEVEVSFNLESREFNGKWYHNINAWKIDKASSGNEMNDFIPEYRPEDIPPEPNDSGESDLPF